MLLLLSTEIENELPGITNLAPKAALNTQATEIDSKIPDITNLATKACLNRKATEIENKIPDMKKTWYSGLCYYS